jgi:hypothetical protein
MKLRLSDWASIAEIFSGIAVVVTLVLLLLGIRDNTEITRASMYADTMESMSELDRTVLADPELRRIAQAYLDRETASLGDSDRSALTFFVASQARTYDMAYSMKNYGLFGENEWSRFEAAICRGYERAVSAGLAESPFLTTTSEDFQLFVSSSC